ncbi:hypothetical protein [Streptomyces sp. NPDC059893]|uniref:hypothetical protein n=1 Tax=Streptomyces sp. NPDC059893 TaxID=3346990 RepID=UPI00364BF230
MATATPAAPTAEQPTPDSQFTPVELDPSLIVRDKCNARETDPAATAKDEQRPERTIPAYVRDNLVGNDHWTRFLSLVENDHRQDMDRRDTLKAAELALVGMDDVDRARAATALGMGRKAGQQLKKARTLSDAELRAATAGGMDLEQTAQFAEVQSVAKADQRLVAALGRDHEDGKGGRGHWDQELALLHAEMADQTKHEAAEKALKDAEIPMLRPAYSYDHFGNKDKPRPLSELTTDLGNALTEELHKECPGHSARLDQEHEPVWHCSAPLKHGHKVRPEAKSPKQPLSEKERAERANTVARNRAWKVARETRQAFAAKLGRSGKALPEPVRVFALNVLVTLPYFYATFVEKGMAQDIVPYLGIKADSNREAVDAAAALPKARSMHVVFAQVAAACEHALREPKSWQGLRAEKAAWLLLLEELGQADDGSYVLSEIEAEAVAAHRPKKKNTGAA